MTHVHGLGYTALCIPPMSSAGPRPSSPPASAPRLAMSTSSPAWATSRSTCCTLTSAGPRPATTRRRSSNRLPWVSRALSACARTRDRRPTAGRASAGRSANDAHGDHRFAGQCRQHRSGARPSLYCSVWQGIRTCSSPGGYVSHESVWNGITTGDDNQGRELHHAIEGRGQLLKPGPLLGLDQVLGDPVRLLLGLGQFVEERMSILRRRLPVVGLLARQWSQAEFSALAKSSSQALDQRGWCGDAPGLPGAIKSRGESRFKAILVEIFQLGDRAARHVEGEHPAVLLRPKRKLQPG